jgi:hypothetical protein
MIALAKAALNKNEALFTSKLDVNVRKKPVKCYIWSITLILELWTLQEIDRKSRGSFEMWYHRRMEKISCTDRVKSEEVLFRVGARNILHAVKRRKANWLGHILCRN